MSGNGKVVCVTGASGFIASWLVKLLLDHGYTVKATVRNLYDPSKVEHLYALEGAKERLLLFRANLTEEGSFDPVIDGCEGVFHTASPVMLSATDPKVEIVHPAVNGTLNVLTSCAKTPSVRRVVITSSIVTVTVNRRPLTPDVIVDESWFSDAAFCEETKNWYSLSKTLAEEAARKFAKENNLNIITLHPGLVIGPLLQPTLNLSSEVILNNIKEGKDLSHNGVSRYVDVRDVADAHVKAFENPNASGRYCIVGTTTYPSVVLKMLHELYPSLPVHDKLKEIPHVKPYQVSKERAESLGVTFMPLERSLKDTVESLKEKNFLTF